MAAGPAPAVASRKYCISNHNSWWMSWGHCGLPSIIVSYVIMKKAVSQKCFEITRNRLRRQNRIHLCSLFRILSSYIWHVLCVFCSSPIQPVRACNVNNCRYIKPASFCCAGVITVPPVTKSDYWPVITVGFLCHHSEGVCWSGSACVWLWAQHGMFDFRLERAAGILNQK